MDKTLRDNRIDMSVELGSYFYDATGINYGLSQEKKNAFLSDIGAINDQYPLSSRELECIDLYRKGYTARDTAKLLNLSSRTVEYYFENIKSKLGCESKKDILKKI